MTSRLYCRPAPHMSAIRGKDDDDADSVDSLDSAGIDALGQSHDDGSRTVVVRWYVTEHSVQGRVQRSVIGGPRKRSWSACVCVCVRVRARVCVGVSPCRRAPLCDGGSTVRKYYISMIKVDGTQQTQSLSAKAVRAHPCVSLTCIHPLAPPHAISVCCHQRLTKRQEYIISLPPDSHVTEVRIAAANGIGTGPCAVATVSLTRQVRDAGRPVYAPSAPVAPVCDEWTDSAVKLAWRHPLRDGGAPVDSYLVCYTYVARVAPSVCVLWGHGVVVLTTRVGGCAGVVACGRAATRWARTTHSEHVMLRQSMCCMCLRNGYAPSRSRRTTLPVLGLVPG